MGRGSTQEPPSRFSFFKSLQTQTKSFSFFSVPVRFSQSELLPISSDGTVAFSNDVERILLHCFSRLVIHQPVRFNWGVFCTYDAFHISNSIRCFWASVCVCVCVGNFLISFQKALIRPRVRCKDEHHVVKVWKINKCSVQLEACFKTANGYSFLGLVLSLTAVMPACVFVFNAACTIWSHRLMRWMWRSRRPRKIRDSSKFKLQLHQKKGVYDVRTISSVQLERWNEWDKLWTKQTKHTQRKDAQLWICKIG